MYNSKLSHNVIFQSIRSNCASRRRGIKNETKKKYTDTILLPRTDFPARLAGQKRVDMDKYIYQNCGFEKLYSWQRDNLVGPEFVLHDGPPYANGTPHMGHAINKVLKDITLRNKVIRGKKVHYVPGWDCHGLPIELKALKSTQTNPEKMAPLDIRNKALNFANEAIKKQREIFSSWGIMANWNESECYFTSNTSYITDELHQFMNLYEKGLLFRDFKPVYWSPSSRTALAEAELKYNANHRSKCATVRFEVIDLPEKLITFKNRKIYALTWTTTPWTLVMNQAIAYSKEITYSLVENEVGHIYIVAQDLVPNLEEKIGPLKPLMSILGNELDGTMYLHPITKKKLPFLKGNHVTTQLGTGLVHTAPAHGPDDFLLALEHEIPVVSMVDEEGKYTELAGHEFCGLTVLDEGTEKVLQYIATEIVHEEFKTHSYPYDWRTNKPVIIKVSHQWFIDINSIKEETSQCVKNIQIYPQTKRASFENTLLSQIATRPYWCVSRQRFWGTPIPVFYHKDTKKPLITRKFINRLCSLMKTHGSDFWWTLSNEELIGKEVLEEWDVNIDNVEKGKDIMDIWFDSGVSWSAVLPEKKATLYMEGLDQIGGWFQSSLLTSVALQGCSPFRDLFVHGFAVDKNNLKMSKSEGNVINPEDITNGKDDFKKHPAYGIDTLRWWVSSHGCQHNLVPVTPALLKESLESVNKLRLILRFLLGALYPYLDNDNSIEAKYYHLDRYMLHRLFHYNNEIQHFYDTYQYHHVCKKILHYVANDVSSVYSHLTKDRLYCQTKESPDRIAVTEVISHILSVLTRTMAPIMPHLAEEIWLYHPKNHDKVPLHQTAYSVPDSWNQPDIDKLLNTALNVRRTISTDSKINTWEQSVVIKAPQSDYDLLSVLQTEKESSTSELNEVLQVSSITLLKENVPEIKIEMEPIGKPLCARCRRYSETELGLCQRCSGTLDAKIRVAM